VKTLTFSQKVSLLFLGGSLVVLKTERLLSYQLIGAAAVCACAAVFVSVLFFLLRDGRVPAAVIFGSLFTLGVIYAAFFTLSFPYPYGRPARVRLAILTEPRVRDNLLEYTARLKGPITLAAGPKAGGTEDRKLRVPRQKLLVRIPQIGGYPERGDLVEVGGVFLELRKGRTGDWDRYLKNRGVQALFEGSSRSLRTIRREPAVSLLSISAVVRSAVETINDRLLLWPQSAFATGILTGRRELLPEDVMESFRRSGTMHILAVSGLHVGFLVLFFLLLCRILRLNQAVSFFALFGVVIFYMVFIGDAPSVKRASLMVMCGILLFLTDRDRNYLNVLSIVFNLLWLTNPLQVADPGFLLSFTATFAILYLVPAVVKLLERALPSFVAVPLAVSFGVQLYLLPVMLAFFGSFSYITVFANLPIVPLAGLALILEILTVLLYPLFMPAAVLVSEVNIVVITTIFRLAGFFARVPPVTVGSFPKVFIPVYFALLTGGLWLLLYRGRTPLSPAYGFQE
jgi:ComEC/Rec2-related protein